MVVQGFHASVSFSRPPPKNASCPASFSRKGRNKEKMEEKRRRNKKTKNDNPMLIVEATPALLLQKSHKHGQL